jgi:hypothetical protein
MAIDIEVDGIIVSNHGSCLFPFSSLLIQEHSFQAVAKSTEPSHLFTPSTTSANLQESSRPRGVENSLSFSILASAREVTS